MKILFFSDIHGITTNLQKLKELDNKEKFDKIVCLGDLYYSGPNHANSSCLNSKEVLDFLTGFKDRLIVLRGNCDSDVDIKASDFPICDNLSLIYVDNLSIYLTHGNTYNIDNKRKFNHKGVLIYGHKHYPFIKKEDGIVFINVGSISLPRNGSKASYCIYQNSTFSIYDILGKKINSVNLKKSND